MKNLSRISILLLGALFLLVACNDGGGGGGVQTAAQTDISPQLNMSYGSFSGSDTGVNITDSGSGSTVVHNPEPMSLLLLGSGLIGLAGYGRKKFFKK